MDNTSNSKVKNIIDRIKSQDLFLNSEIESESVMESESAVTNTELTELNEDISNDNREKVNLNTEEINDLTNKIKNLKSNKLEGVNSYVLEHIEKRNEVNNIMLNAFQGIIEDKDEINKKIKKSGFGLFF